jgi:pseudouridine-5'-phosphate glycosidase
MVRKRIFVIARNNIVIPACFKRESDAKKFWFPHSLRLPGMTALLNIYTKLEIHETTVIWPKYNTVIPACFKRESDAQEVFGFPARCAPGNDCISSTVIPTKKEIHETTVSFPKYNIVIPAFFKRESDAKKFLVSPLAALPGMTALLNIYTKLEIHETTVICPKYNTVIPAFFKRESGTKKFLDSRLAALH